MKIKFKNLKMRKALLVLVILPALSYSQAVRTTIADGLATNPLIWDCTCIPFINDSIIVNHNVTLNVDYGFTDGAVVINASGKVIGDSPTRAFAFSGTANFVNHGEFDVARTAFFGGTAINTGTFAADSFYTDISTAQGWVSNGDMNIANSYWNRGTFVLGSGAELIVGDNFYNGDSIAPGVNAVLVNDGAIRVNLDFANADTIRGTGQFCINGTSLNIGIISGTQDFCDISPGGSAVDLNLGTVDASVQICSSPCTIGIDGEEEISFSAYPNPVKNQLRFKSDDPIEVSIYDISGRLIWNSSEENESHIVDVSTLSPGSYVYVVSNMKISSAGRFIKE